MDVEKLEGRELDWLIAETVMGFEWFTLNPKLYSVLTGERFLAQPTSQEVVSGYYVKGSINMPLSNNPFEMVPYYSTNITWAWRVAEKIGLSIVNSEDGYYAIKPVDIWHERIGCSDKNSIRLIGSDGEIFMPVKTAPLAICRAALKSQATLAATKKEG